jgi:hypothetical protein
MIDHKAAPINEALDAVKDRGATYGDAFTNHARIAEIWRVILGKHNITPEQVAQCMIAVKLARLVQTPGHYDSYVDICGYAGVANACAVTQADHDETERDIKTLLGELDEEEIEERAREKASEMVRDYKAVEGETAAKGVMVDTSA